MTITPEQFKQIVTKEDLVRLTTSEELSRIKDNILVSNDKLMKKLDDIVEGFKLFE